MIGWILAAVIIGGIILFLYLKVKPITMSATTGSSGKIAGTETGADIAPSTSGLVDAGLTSTEIAFNLQAYKELSTPTAKASEELAASTGAVFYIQTKYFPNGPPGGGPAGTYGSNDGKNWSPIAT